MEKNKGDCQRRVLEAECFVLRGPDGKKRAVLGTVGEGKPLLSLLDDTEAPRVSLYLDENESPAFDLKDRNGLARVCLSLLREGGVAALFTNETGACQLTLAVLPGSGGPAVMLSDEYGNQRLFISLVNGPSVLVYDEHGKVLHSLPPRKQAQGN